MRQSKRSQPDCSYCFTTSRLINWMIPLLLIVYFLSGSVSSVYADSTKNDIQNYTNRVYLPIITNIIPVYYVSTTGNDHNPGTLNAPWRTISYAVGHLAAGDILYIRGGTYHEKISIYQNGFSYRALKLLAFPGENPIIDGENHIPGPGGALIGIFGEWVEVSGVEVINSAYYGIGLFGKHNTVANVFAHHNQKTGIYISGDYGTVQDSKVWRNSLINEYGASSSWSSGIAASRDTEDGITEYPIIQRNVVWENWGQGINTYEADHVTIEDNISHDNYSTNIYIHDETNVVCQRNFIYMNPSSYVYGYGANVGIMMGDERDISSANIVIINNISFNNSYNYALHKGTNIITNVLVANNIFVNGIVDGNILLRGNHQNVVFKNNIIQQDGNLPLITIALSPEVTFSHNLWSKTPSLEVSSEGDVIGNPLLAQSGDYFTPDWFRLTAFSPAIDAALPLPEVIVDFFGNIREGPPDIGANEFILVP